MISSIIELINVDLGETTENIEIARGKYKIPDTWRGLSKTLKRKVKEWKK